jgi:hypothetical protein
MTYHTDTLTLMTEYLDTFRDTPSSSLSSRCSVLSEVYYGWPMSRKRPLFLAHFMRSPASDLNTCDLVDHFRFYLLSLFFGGISL